MDKIERKFFFDLGEKKVLIKFGLDFFLFIILGVGSLGGKVGRSSDWLR